MPTAPADYQTRYPIDFPDIDPAVRQRVVQLYADDGGKARAILYRPSRGNPRTAILMAHPRADFAHHYTIPYWVEAGFGACALNTRYLNNDTMMLHENLILDLAAAIRFLREEEGFEWIVMLGNSGGGSLFAYYDAQARAPKGERVAAPPGGGPPDLNRFELPSADGLILLAAHPGQGMVLMGSIDAAVADEHDPFASDPELDMYDERNGYRTPPEPSRCPPRWLERYRAAQRARVARLDAIARSHLAAADQARAASKRPDFAAAPAADRALMQRRAMRPQIMVIYRTQANPNYLDLFAATRPFQLSRLRSRARRDARGLALNLVRPLLARPPDPQPADGDGPDARGGRDGRPGHLRRRCARRVGGLRRCRQAVGIHRRRRPLHARGWQPGGPR
jgi:hypothetical protein